MHQTETGSTPPPNNNEKWIMPLYCVHVLSEMKLNLLTQTMQRHNLMMQQLQGNKSVEMLTRCINKKDYPPNTSGAEWLWMVLLAGSLRVCNTNIFLRVMSLPATWHILIRRESYSL